MDLAWWTRQLGTPISRFITSRLWGHPKNLVYETLLDSDEDLVARISEIFARALEMPGIFERVRHSLNRRCQPFIVTGGRNFKQFL